MRSFHSFWKNTVRRMSISDGVYCCCYVLIRLPDKSHLLIGPYSHTRFDASLFYKLAHNLHFPADHHLPALKDYYMSLPLVNQEDSFHLLILSMMDFLWDSDQAYTVDFIKIAFDEQILYGDYRGTYKRL